MSLARIYQFFSGAQFLLPGFPLRQDVPQGGTIVAWPCLRMELSRNDELVALEYAWGLLPMPVRLAYRNLCESRFVHAGRLPPPPVASALVVGPLLPPRPVSAPSVVRAHRSDLRSTAPTYVLALLELKAAGGPLRYTELAVRLASKGYRITVESVLGSMSGFYSTPRGKAVLVRVGKGEYELRPDWREHCDLELRQELESVEVPVGKGRAPQTALAPVTPANGSGNSSSSRASATALKASPDGEAPDAFLPAEVTVGPATFQRAFLQKLAYRYWTFISSWCCSSPNLLTTTFLQVNLLTTSSRMIFSKRPRCPFTTATLPRRW